MTGGEQGQGHDLGGLDWRDGVIPVSRRFDDPYFSLNDGLAETGHVFLAGNNLPARLTPGFQVAELGFGTGLNLLALHVCNPGHPIRFTSFEAFPLDSADIARALEKAQKADAPVLIACRTIIGFGMPGRQGTQKAHSDAPGAEIVAASRAMVRSPHEQTESRLSWIHQRRWKQEDPAPG